MILEILMLLIFLVVIYIAYTLYKQNQAPAIESFGNVMKELGVIKQTLEDRAKQEQEYREKTDKTLTDFVRVISGTKRRGGAGEVILKEILSVPIKSGMIVTNLNVGTKTVEFAWNLGDGKYIPIDSKLPEIDELYKRYNNSKDIEEQKKLKKIIIDKIKKRIEEVKKYKNQVNTIDKVILALPDGLMELIPEISTEIKKSGVLVCGYSYVFFFCYYLAEAYHKSLETGDIGEYIHAIEELTSLLKEIEKKTVTIERGIRIIEKANSEIKRHAITSEKHRIKRRKKIAMMVKQ